MSEISQILVPTDFSECARGALREAVWLAREHGAHLDLLHVITSRDGSELPATPFPGETDAVRELARNRGGDSGVTHHVAHGPLVAPVILDYARDLGSDLIVIGSHGRRGFRRWVLGSVSQEVLREANCSVLVFRGADTPDAMPGRVLAAIDFSFATSAVVPEAEELARAREAGLDLLHVVEMPAYPDFYVATLALPETRARARERLSGIAAGLDPTLDVDVVVLHGRTDDEIRSYAETEGHQLIVLASHGHSGLKRLVLGSTAEGVARRAPCSVLVLKRTAAGSRSASAETADAIGAV